MTSSLPAAPASYSGTSTYAYDSHDQLNTEQVARFGGYTNTLAFDGAGNPTTWKDAMQTFDGLKIYGTEIPPIIKVCQSRLPTD